MSEQRYRVRPDRGSRAVIEDEPLTRHAADTVLRPTGSANEASEPGFVLGRTHVHWGAIVAGLLSALTALYLLSLLGGAIGLTSMNAATAAAQGGVPADAGRNTAIWEAIAGILSFLLGGYVVSRAAHLLDEGWGAFHGALVFMLAVPLILWLAGQGLGSVLGSIGNVAGGLHPDVLQTTAQNNATQVGDTAAALRNGLWGSLIGSLLALAASAIGGWLGVRHLFELDRFTHRRL